MRRAAMACVHGRCGSLFLHCMKLFFTTPCRLKPPHKGHDETKTCERTDQVRAASSSRLGSGRRGATRTRLLVTLATVLAACQAHGPLSSSGNKQVPPTTQSQVSTALEACSSESSFTGLPPITDLGPGQTYMGQPGGLYPNSSNDMPAAHHTPGKVIARGMVPLNTDGAYDPTNGRIVAVNIGISL